MTAYLYSFPYYLKVSLIWITNWRIAPAKVGACFVQCITTATRKQNPIQSLVTSFRHIVFITNKYPPPQMEDEYQVTLFWCMCMWIFQYFTIILHAQNLAWQRFCISKREKGHLLLLCMLTFDITNIILRFTTLIIWINNPQKINRPVCLYYYPIPRIKILHCVIIFLIITVVSP